MASRGAARNGRGGYQEPARPAAVSGPAALSARTDKGQPITPTRADRPGGEMGDRQASIERQKVTPLFAAPETPAPQMSEDDLMAAESAPIPNATDVWGPTERPWEPVTAGAEQGPGSGPVLDDRDQTEILLRAAYAQSRSPYLLRLLGSFGG